MTRPVKRRPESRGKQILPRMSLLQKEKPIRYSKIFGRIFTLDQSKKFSGKEIPLPMCGQFFLISKLFKKSRTGRGSTEFVEIRAHLIWA